MNLPIMMAVAHFVGDALLQSDWMALNKSKTTRTGLLALTIHAALYAVCFAWWGWEFVVLTFLLHWVTDFITSRVGSGLWFIDMAPIVSPDEKQGWMAYTHYARFNDKRHWFFVWLLFDQLLHYVMLAWTAGLFGV